MLFDNRIASVPETALDVEKPCFIRRRLTLDEEPFGVWFFEVESLILAQNERWRRA